MVLPKIVYLFVFTSLSDWEIGYATTGINNPMMQVNPEKYLVKTFSIDGKPIITMGGLKITPDLSIDDVTLSNAEMLILPGGLSWNEGANQEVLFLAQKFHESQIKVAAICGATLGLAKTGLLDSVKHTSNSIDYIKISEYHGSKNYQHTLVANDKGIITASGTASLEFAREIFQELEIYKKEVLEAWYKSFKTGSLEAYGELVKALDA